MSGATRYTQTFHMTARGSMQLVTPHCRTLMWSIIRRAEPLCAANLTWQRLYPLHQHAARCPRASSTCFEADITGSESEIDPGIFISTGTTQRVRSRTSMRLSNTTCRENQANTIACSKWLHDEEGRERGGSAHALWEDRLSEASVWGRERVAPHPG
eukprot:3795625-Pleurochrysis_carterae.AAC.3